MGEESPVPKSTGLWWMEGELIADVVVGTPDELVALLENRFGDGIAFEMSADERRVQLAVTLARQLQDRMIAAVTKAGWSVFNAKATTLRRLIDPVRIFTSPAKWGGCPVPLILVRPTTSAAYPAPDGFGSVVMLNCSAPWRLLGSLALADQGWFRAGRFDTASIIRDA